MYTVNYSKLNSVNMFGGSTMTISENTNTKNPNESEYTFITETLTGVLKNDYDDKAIRAGRLAK